MLTWIMKILKTPLKLIKRLFYKSVFAELGRETVIKSPLHIDGGKNIYIGNNVLVQYKSWLAAVPLTGETDCRLVLSDGVVVGHFNHIYATKRIVINRDVLLADRVYIADNSHEYRDISLAVKKQSIIQLNEVEIGEGSWIGEGVCIIGAKIGKHCVIGANSVVTKDIEDYSLAVGVPAKVIKRFCLDTNQWKRIV